MKIIHGEYEIYDSGFIISADLSDTKFVLSDAPLLEVVFRVSMAGERTEISLESLGDNTIALVFTKPQELGFGPTTPIKVGRLAGKDLYVSFRVNMRGNDGSYGLEYTFYTREILSRTDESPVKSDEHPVNNADIITL